MPKIAKTANAETLAEKVVNLQLSYSDLAPKFEKAMSIIAQYRRDLQHIAKTSRDSYCGRRLQELAEEVKGL